MKSLFELFDEAKDMENMGQGRVILVMGGKPFKLFNAEILDPYMGALSIDTDEGKKLVMVKESESLEFKACFVDKSE